MPVSFHLHLQANHHAQPVVPGVSCFSVMKRKLLCQKRLRRSLLKQTRRTMMTRLKILQLLLKERMTRLKCPETKGALFLEKVLLVERKQSRDCFALAMQK